MDRSSPPSTGRRASPVGPSYRPRTRRPEATGRWTRCRTSSTGRRDELLVPVVQDEVVAGREVQDVVAAQEPKPPRRRRSSRCRVRLSSRGPAPGLGPTRRVERPSRPASISRPAPSVRESGWPPTSPLRAPAVPAVACRKCSLSESPGRRVDEDHELRYHCSTSRVSHRAQDMRVPAILLATRDERSRGLGLEPTRPRRCS